MADREPLAPEQIEHVRLWVDALRSGDFKQGQNVLRANRKYCCLGVACEQYHNEVGGQWTDQPELGRQTFTAKHAAYAATFDLPTEVAEWLLGNKDDTDPYLIDETGETHLASRLNDDKGYTFAQIADAIERTYPEVKR